MTKTDNNWEVNKKTPTTPDCRLTGMEKRTLSQITLMLDLLIYSFSTLENSSMQLTNRITTESF